MESEIEEGIPLLMAPFPSNFFPAAVEPISISAIKPHPPLPGTLQRRWHLTAWDIAMLSVQYIQKGLLFPNTSPSFDVLPIIRRLKASLAVAIRHFYPLAGRFVTQNAYDDDGNIGGMHVAVDCNDDGARFIHAVAKGISVADVLAVGEDVPEFVRGFFPMDEAVNCDGHTLPLVVVQLTELTDGYFIALSFNHAVGDGTSYWHFFNVWAEICRSATGETADDFAAVELSRPPVFERWFGDVEPPLKLPFKTHDEFIERFKMPLLRERILHFSKESLAALKARANREYDEESGSGKTISSLQALSALMWRCITRARGLPPWQTAGCRLAIQNRSRLRPPLQADSFGNSIYAIRSSTLVEELLSKSLGWSAALLRQAVMEHDDEKIRKMVSKWVASPVVYQQSSMFDPLSVMVGSSPRFEMYECEFGWGRGVALRSGIAHKFCGKVTVYPGREGGGSMDLEVCLVPDTMDKLLMDPEFMEVVCTDDPLS